MNEQIAITRSPAPEILALADTSISDYITRKRRKAELGGIIAKLNHELMFGTSHTRKTASDALQKLGYVLD